MSELENLRPSWPSRLLAAGNYLGLTSVLWLFRRNRGDEYFSHHARQALAAQWLLFVAILAPFVVLSLQTYLFVYHDDWRSFAYRVVGGIGLVMIVASLVALVWPRLRGAESVAFGGLMMGGLLLPVALPGEMTGFLSWLGLWAVISLWGIILVLAGSMWPIPLVSRLGQHVWFTHLAFVGNIGVMIVVILFIGVTFHADTLAREDVVPAPVYFLFDDREYPALGSWGPKLICYRVSRIARRRWGPGSVVVAPIIGENLRTAFAHGRFVVLISHGYEGKIVTADRLPGGRWLAPDFSAAWASPGKDLQYVYISACEGEQRGDEWRATFAPAEVVTFDRTSGGIEHLWWMWFEAPDRLRGTK